MSLARHHPEGALMLTAGLDMPDLDALRELLERAIYRFSMTRLPHPEINRP